MNNKKYYRNKDNWLLTPVKPNSSSNRAEFYILNEDLTHKLGKDMGMKSKYYINKKMTTVSSFSQLREV